MAEIYDYEPLFGSWKVGELLGKGGFGEVYAISCEQFGLTLYSAVKRIPISENHLAKDPKLLDRVKMEITTMLKMKGTAHIVGIEEFSIEQWKDGRGQDVLIRMELLECVESIIRSEAFDSDEVVKLGIHICRMLELCDKHAVIHRDIRPPNIFRSAHGNYKLGDFGIARMTTVGSAPSYASTDDYMAPEMMRMYGRYDKRADIYSLGLTLYVLLNGNRLPFETEKGEDSPNIRRILDAEPMPLLRGIPEWLSQVVQKACTYNPDERYTNAKEMREALERGGRDNVTDNKNESPGAVVCTPPVNDGNVRRPVKGERICFGQYEWQVLKLRGNKALILSEKIIENKPYNETWNDTTWETCTLRQYLNAAFLDTFSTPELSRIALTRVMNKKNPWYGTAGSKTTNDKIFLLSIDEVVEYLGDSGQLKHRPRKDAYWIDDKYNKARIALNNGDAASWWWLRSPGLYDFNAASVSSDGWLSIDGHNVDNDGSGVRPSLWLNIEF